MKSRKLMVLNIAVIVLLLCAQFVLAEEIVVGVSDNPYSTGHIWGEVLYTTVQGDMNIGSFGWTIYLGFTVFDIQDIPEDVTITDINLNTYTSQSSVFTVEVRHLNVEPDGINGDAIYSALWNGSTFASGWDPLANIGWDDVDFNQTALNSLQEAVDNGDTWWAIGYFPVGFAFGYGAFDGVNEENLPYLDVTYEPAEEPAPLNLTATPWDIDPFVGPNGGNFRWDAGVENVSGADYTFDAWTELILPDGTGYGPLDLFEGLNLLDGATLEASPAQSVPGFAPNGMYTFIAKVGQYGLGQVDAEASFDFAKLPLEGPALGSFNNGEGWVLTDWFELDETGAPEAEYVVPNEYAIKDVYPNPFNPATNITIALPASSDLTVTVFNSMGQQVDVLANGHYSGGYHNFSFDASSMSSGVYFVYASVPGQMNEVRKVMLMK